MHAVSEPFLLRWRAGTCSAGYLGWRRWRFRASDGTVHDGEDAAHVATRIAEAALERYGRWSYDDGRVRFDLRGRPDLERFLAGQLAFGAHALWARGVVPIATPALESDYAFTRFCADADAAARCARLAERLHGRMKEHPSAAAVLAGAVRELRALGHDLWSWDAGERWGWDYVERREGRGLRLELVDGPSGLEVDVEFVPSR